MVIPACRLIRAGCGERSAGSPWRHRHPRRRRKPRPNIRSPAAPSARGRRETRRATLVGIYRARGRGDERQSQSRQQGRRADHHSGKSLGAMAKAGSTNLVDVLNYANGHKKGLVHGHARLRPVAATGRGRRRQSGLLHHRKRQRVRLQAGALHRSPPTRRCTSGWTTWTSIAAPSSTARRACRVRQRVFDLILKTASGQPNQGEL